MKNLFGDPYNLDPVKINMYADEIQSKQCPYTKERWIYIGLIVENLSHPLLNDIISERFLNNFDKTSLYYNKNNRIIHWSEINSADSKNICKRWFKYILDPNKSGRKFYAYILGINDSKLNRNKFGSVDQFSSKYNRFFRSAILYALKSFFPNRKIIVKNIYHEEGQQQTHEYFPWHCIYKIKQNEKNITFDCSKVEFLPKDHRKDKKSNLIQLCDVFMGATTSIIHGIKKSNTSKYHEELMALIYPLVKRMIKNHNNVNSGYQHTNRIMIRFFPKKEISSGTFRENSNLFYVKRNLLFEDEINQQGFLF